jgi:hypothetical protein
MADRWESHLGICQSDPEDLEVDREWCLRYEAEQLALPGVQ